jgi:hypothetical protein
MSEPICGDIPTRGVTRMAGRIETVYLPGNHPIKGHWCCCVMKPGHMTRIPWAGHGCPCGSIWDRRAR